MKTRVNVAVALLGVFLSACGTVNQQIRDEIDQTQRNRRIETLSAPSVQVAQTSRVVEVTGAFLPVTPVSVRKGEWLKQHSVQFEIRNATSLASVVAKLAEQGINIVSDLPLDTYTYVGKINRTDGETALRAVLGAVGLDYDIDDTRKLVVIKPMASRTWFLNIGNRKSTYSSDGSGITAASVLPSSPASSSTSSSTGSSIAGIAELGNNTAGATGSAGSNDTGQSSISQTTNGTSVAAADDFWPSLSNELGNRLAIMLPRPRMRAGALAVAMPMNNGAMPPPLPMLHSDFGNGSASNDVLYVKHKIGAYSLNPETGAVMVQAPHWVLQELDTYLKRVQEMYNTDITFQGEVVLVTTNRSDSEGFDLAAFTTWAAGKYGAVISNNALGGITVSMPGGSVQANAQSVAGPLIGLTYSGSNNAIDIFNAYLSEIGKVSVIQRPLVTTTSGVPGVFSKKFTDYYNTITQQAVAGGTGSAATATQNTVVPVELGTELRINPRIDVATGLIRAQLVLNQVIRSGSKVVPQTITFGTTATTVNTTIPLLTKQNLSGEILLRDGDLIIVGGQTEDNMSVDENGLPGQNGPMGGILGVKKANRGAQTYYFALRVAVNKRQ